MVSEVPPRTCGFCLTPGDLSEELVSYYDEGASDWYTDYRISTCCRNTWNNTNRCIWHADINEERTSALEDHLSEKKECLDGAILRNLELRDRIELSGCSLLASDLKNVNLENAELEEVDLRYANLEGANFRGADFEGADLRHADLERANLSEGFFLKGDLSETAFQRADLSNADVPEADLSGAELWEADLTEINLSESILTGANIEDATLERAELRGADFQDARLYQTHFTDVHITSSTDFGKKCWYDNLDCEIDLEDSGYWPWEVSLNEAAIWTYRRLETLHEEYALSARASEFHVLKKEAERSLNWDEGKYGRWAVNTAMRYLTNHGESVGLVLVWWAAVIIGAGVLFPFVGGIKDPDGNVYAIESISELGMLSGWSEVLLNFYFSVITFSTIGYGDLSPAGPLSRVLVAVESIAGALLLALLIFVIGRRVSR